MQVLEIEGPMVSMITDYIFVSKDQVAVEARLEGFSSLPVTADVVLSQRHLHGRDTVTDPLLEASLSLSYVKWDPFHQGTKSVIVQLNGDQIAELQNGAVLISLNNATNADVDEHRSTTVATQLSREDLTVSFDLQPNQVFFRSDTIEIPVQATPSRLAVPASVACSGTCFQVINYI